MNSDSPDAGPETVDSDVEESEAVSLVRQYLDSDDTVDADELRDHFQRYIDGTIVDIEREDVGVVVIVEVAPSGGDEPIRDAYSVHPSTDPDGEPTLDWSYLGSAN